MDSRALCQSTRACVVPYLLACLRVYVAINLLYIARNFRFSLAQYTCENHSLNERSSAQASLQLHFLGERTRTDLDYMSKYAVRCALK